MPTYDFHCEKCEKPFEMISGIKEYTGHARCPTCKTASAQRIFTSNVHFLGTKVESREFNPGLGIITKSARHRKDEARARGLEEIGNTDKAKMHKHFDDARALKRKKNWEAV